MSQWDVELIYVEGTSNKFWRARTDECRLYVNYGRIGTNGQTQVKDFPTPEKAVAEMEKVAGSKRRKGYSDGEGGGEQDAEQAPAKASPKPAAQAPQRLVADMELAAAGRKIELRLEQQDARLRTVVVEHYDSPRQAAEAYERACSAMADEGYKKVGARDDL